MPTTQAGELAAWFWNQLEIGKFYYTTIQAPEGLGGGNICPARVGNAPILPGSVL